MAAKVRQISAPMTKIVLAGLALASVQAGWAAQPHMNCKVYEQQEQASVEAHRRADPAIRDERFDMVFYSPSRNACLASVVFVKGHSTYSGILDVTEGQMIWARGYRGVSFTPAKIIAMDLAMDEQIQAMELPSGKDASPHSLQFLPLFLDRTMNTWPTLRNTFADRR
jgi:predicted cobalt transporter CbtA